MSKRLVIRVTLKHFHEVDVLEVLKKYAQQLIVARETHDNDTHAPIEPHFQCYMHTNVTDKTVREALRAKKVTKSSNVYYIKHAREPEINNLLYCSKGSDGNPPDIVFNNFVCNIEELNRQYWSTRKAIKEARKEYKKKSLSYEEVLQFVQEHNVDYQDIQEITKLVVKFFMDKGKLLPANFLMERYVTSIYATLRYEDLQNKNTTLDPHEDIALTVYGDFIGKLTCQIKNNVI